MSSWALVGAAVFGLGVGTMTGMLGVGGGFLIVPYLVLVAGLDQLSAQGTSLLVIAPVAASASWPLYRLRLAARGEAARVGVAGAVLAVVGSSLAFAVPGRALRLLLAATIVVVGLRMVYSAARRLRARPTHSTEA